MIKESEQLLFGSKKDTDRLWIYSRYAAGDPISIIAADARLSLAQVYDLMRECPDDYEKTKKQREQFSGLRVGRSLSLVDAYNLRLLEKFTEDETVVTAEMIKELAKLCKELAHRNQLYEGKATEIVDSRFSTKTLSVEEAESRLAEAKAAGTGIDNSSIEGNGSDNETS